MPKFLGTQLEDEQKKKVYNRYLGWKQYLRPECFKALK